MSRLDESRDALIEGYWRVGLEFFWPQQRINPHAPTAGVDVTEVAVGDQYHRLTYSRKGLKLSDYLARTDVLWHQSTNMLALVVHSIDMSRVVVRPLCGCDSEEEQKEFMVNEGRGRWVPVWQAWEEGWPIPKEIYDKVPRDLSLDAAIDFMPETREQNRAGWASTGAIDPNMPLSRSAKRYFKKARAAMERMADGIIPGEADTKLFETVEELRAAVGKGGVSTTRILFDGRPESDGEQIISYPGQKKKARPEGH